MPRRPFMHHCIREAAEAKGITIAEACREAGVHRADAHHGSMNSDRARALAGVLGIEEADLLEAYRADEYARADARIAVWWGE